MKNLEQYQRTRNKGLLDFLSKHYPESAEQIKVKAFDGVSFDLKPQTQQLRVLLSFPETLIFYPPYMTWHEVDSDSRWNLARIIAKAMYADGDWKLPANAAMESLNLDAAYEIAINNAEEIARIDYLGFVLHPSLLKDKDI